MRNLGGTGPPAVLVPSLINPPNILDLDSEVSLAKAIKAMGRQVFLLDWGTAGERYDHDVSAHVSELLVPLLRSLPQYPALVGYCLGGTMALAAASLAPLERVATLAAPWHFSRYPDPSRAALQLMWQKAQGSAGALGALPMEVLQAAFWSLDPERTVAKFAAFAQLDPATAEAQRFIALEDWANEGEPLPFAAARELIERLFGDDLPGRGEWRISGTSIAEQPGVPLLHLTAGKDRIAPADTAPAGPGRTISSGHVGMIVGKARTQLHDELAAFLA